MGLITLLPILGFASFFARALGTTFAIAMLHAVSAIIVVLYVGGLADALWWSALAVHLVGVVLLGYELWRLNSDGKHPKISVPFAVLVVCVALFWLVHRDSLYLYYDEYAHWGVYVKEMLALDGFWLADTNSMHPRYPPAAPLWQYLFNAFRAPSEGTAYLAQFVLLMTPLLVLWERITLRHAFWVFLIVAVCALALTNFGLGITSLYVDHVIGVWFVGTVLCFVRESPDLRRSAIYALPLTTIALLKESSLAFSLAAAGILAFLILFDAWKRSGHLASSAARAALMAVVVTVPSVLCLEAWERRLDGIGAPTEHEAVGGIVSGLIEESGQIDATTGAEITRRFVEVFAGQQLSNDEVTLEFNAFSYSIRELFADSHRLSTLGFFLVFAIWWMGLLFLVLRGRERWIWGIVACGIALTGVAFILALFLTYRFTSGEYGLVLSSYTRYVQTVALPMLLVSFAPLLPAFRSFGNERVWSIAGRSVTRQTILALSGCIGLYVFETPHLRPLLEKNAVLTLRQQIEPITATIQAALGRSSVWLYLPNDRENGFVGRLFQYLMAPTPTYVEREKAFLQGSPGSILEAWSRFDYVWLPAELEPETMNRFTEIAGLPLDNRLFLVSTDASGTTRLSPITSPTRE
jgi:hypothetical protein